METRTTTEMQDKPMVLNNAAMPGDTRTDAAPVNPRDASADMALQTSADAADKAMPDAVTAKFSKADTTDTTDKADKADTAGATDKADATADSAECAGPRENKEQLHRRVDDRVAELEAALAQLCDAAATSERAQALKTALQLARDNTGSGWEHVGEMEAARLSQWLATTAPLVAVGNADTGPLTGGAVSDLGHTPPGTEPLNETSESAHQAKAKPVTANYPA